MPSLESKVATCCKAGPTTNGKKLLRESNEICFVGPSVKYRLVTLKEHLHRPTIGGPSDLQPLFSPRRY